MLPQSVENRLKRFHPPDDPKDFEKLCADVFEFIIKDYNLPILNVSHNRIKVNGVSGDGQAGVDIRDPATLAVGQCKKQQKIMPQDLQDELDLLMDYEEAVSNYFFLISHEGVRKTLSDWVKKKNRLADADRCDSTPYPCLPSVALPTLHILGWDEIRSYLGKSRFLLWKWKISFPIGNNAHLEALDLKSLQYQVRRARGRIDPEDERPSLEAIDGIESLLSNIDVDGVEEIGKDSLVSAAILQGITDFRSEVRDAVKAIATYDDAIEKIDKLDGVAVEKGYKLLNELMRQQARIAAYPYLRQIIIECRELMECLNSYGHWDWEPEVFEDGDGEWHEAPGDSHRRYNFDDENPGGGLPYTSRKKVRGLAKSVVREIKKLKEYL